MKVIFMGSPDFAIPAIEALNNSSDIQLLAAYTQPPKQGNRSMGVLKSKIQQFCDRNFIKVHHPVSLKNEKEQKIFQEYKADIAVVAAYGLILPQEILEGTKYGCINIHPSLLPRWRGAAPIQRAIMAGDKQTGMCIMKMDAGLDTGDVILQKKLKILPTEDAGNMHDKLAKLGAEMTLDAINLIAKDKAKYTKQSEKGITYAHKIGKEDEIINFKNEGANIINQIRGLSPYPAAHFQHGGKKYKIFEAEFEQTEHSRNCGEIVENGKKITCKDGYIKPLSIQKEGKRLMRIEDFLRGNKI